MKHVIFLQICVPRETILSFTNPCTHETILIFTNMCHLWNKSFFTNLWQSWSNSYFYKSVSLIKQLFFYKHVSLSLHYCHSYHNLIVIIIYFCTNQCHSLNIVFTNRATQSAGKNPISYTLSCVSLSWPTTSSEWKYICLFIKENIFHKTVTFDI